MNAIAEPSIVANSTHLRFASAHGAVAAAPPSCPHGSAPGDLATTTVFTSQWMRKSATAVQEISIPFHCPADQNSRNQFSTKKSPAFRAGLI
jgi:hypothetical protein